MKYILDTNTLIYYLDGTLPQSGFEFILDALQSRQCCISVISKIEVLGFQFPNEAVEQQAEKFVASLPVFNLTDEVVNKTIDIRKMRKPKVADAIIAATAILHDMTLVSRNEKDFRNLPGLNFINPFEF